MPVAKQTRGKLPELIHGFTPEQIAANFELLKQELAGMESAAIYYFSNFTVPPRAGEKSGQWRAWLLYGVDDLDTFYHYPQRVDFVLKNLSWFKKKIREVQVKLDDEIPYNRFRA